MSSTPWFQFYSSDWLAGTRGLSAVETGIYITLIASMYDRSAPIKNDSERLSRLCGASPRQFKLACQKLIDEGKIILTKDGLWNHKVAEQLQLRAAKTGKAKISADARWNEKNEQKQQEADANALPKQSSNDAIQNQNQKELRKEDTKKYLPKETDSNFGLFKTIYPKRAGNADWKSAEKAWIAAINRAAPEVIISKAREYAAWCDLSGKAKTEYVKQARSWLNADGWNETYDLSPQRNFSNGTISKTEHPATVAANKLRVELGLEPPSAGFRFDE